MVPRPPNIEDSFRVPSLFTGGLREFAGLLSLLPVLLGSPRGRFFWSFSFIHLCVFPRIIVLVSLRVFQLVFWVSRVHLGNGIVPCVGTGAQVIETPRRQR